MIVSIHLPKCAGTSLKSSIANAFGDQCFLDYGNLVVDQSKRANQVRLKKKKMLINAHLKGELNYKVIHGHFYASKYLDVIECPRWVTVLRNPLELVPSYFNFLRSLNRDGLLINIAKEMNSLEEFVVHPWFCNIMTKLIYPLRLKDFSMVGTVEYYKNYILSLEEMAGVKLDSGIFKNVSRGEGVGISSKLESMIIDNNQNDCALYSQVEGKGGLYSSGPV